MTFPGCAWRVAPVIRKSFTGLMLGTDNEQEWPGVLVEAGKRLIRPLEQHVQKSRGMKGHNMHPRWLLWEVEMGVGENSLSKIHPPEQSDWTRLTQLLKRKEDRVKGRRMKNEAENEGAMAHFLCYYSPDPLARYSLAWGILPHRKVTWGECDACCFSPANWC